MEGNNEQGQANLNEQQEKKSNVAGEAKNKAKNVAANKIKNVLKKNAGKQSLMKALAPILIKVGLVLLILFVIIGIIMFLVTMPGMVMDQLKKLFSEVSNAVARFFGADSTQQIAEQNIYSVLDRLETMGYDLKGYGFLTDYVDKDSEGNLLDDEDDGVKRNDNDQISEAESDFVKFYIISDNYIYTLKNENLVFQSEASNWLKKAWDGAVATFYKGANFLYGPLLDFIGVTDGVKEAWGRGMLDIYYDTGKVGIKGDPLNTSLFNWDSVKIDAQNKTMAISKRGLFNDSTIEYSLDGWTGRYGMPLEFLMSIHLATLMPDLATDMATKFPTVIELYLHETEGQMNTAVKAGDDDNTYITKDKLVEDGIISDSVFENDCVWHATGDIYNSTDDKYVYEEEKLEKFLEYGIPHSGNCTCGQNDEKYCQACLSYWSSIIADLKDKSKTISGWQPYIATVKDHWYRDVYFVKTNNTPDFVDYDYDYEALYKERWTLYETDDSGEYILYKVDEEGNITDEKYDGTSEEAREKGIAVAKKAVTIDSSDTDILKDLKWSKSDDIWSAYAPENKTTNGTYKKIGEDEENATEADKKRNNTYVKFDSSSGVVQKGEGQRTETNPEIKKMFLINKYFRYDGSAETAEVITELRKHLKSISDQDSFYGPIPDGGSSDDKNYMEESVTMEDDDGNSKEYKVSDYVATVSLNQDSMNAFSMLENTHTLDADYIYRDFKELVVELGYFTKKELTDETPRLLQFLVPNTGSFGYPLRIVDKNENEYGTVIHSKGDLDAVKLQKTILAEEGYDPNVDNVSSEPDDEENNNTDTDSRRNHGEQSNLNNKNQDELIAVSGQKENMMTNFEADLRNNLDNTVGDASGGFKADTLLDTAKNCWTYIVENGQRYSYGGASQPINNGNTVDCSSFVSWILLEYGFEEFKSHPHTSQSFYETNFNDLYGWEEIPVDSGQSPIDQLQPGDIFVRYGNGTHHVTFVVEVDTAGSKIKCYDCGNKGNWTKSEAQGGNPIDRSYFLTRTGPGKIIRVENPKQNKGEKYNGYIGNEGVVSPVTGILLEYGEYNGEKDSVSNEEYRANIDYKYPLNLLSKNENNESEENTSGDSSNADGAEISEADIPHDHLGYAKILVLDKKTYAQLEKEFGEDIEGINDDNDSLLNNKNNFVEDVLEKEDDLEDWTDEQKTIYAYKEFAETYEKAGIAGHIVYIDGFKCEYPDEEYPQGNTGQDSGTSGETESVKSDFIPEGESISLDTFKDYTDVEDSISSEDGVSLSLYEPDEEYKMASKKATDRLNAETKVKEEAAPIFYTGNKVKIQLTENGTPISYDGIFIKEGTVIGRTVTDKELIDEIRDEKFGSYDELRGNDADEEKMMKLIGNYVRMILLDLNRDNVENVEDYLKLDDGEEDQVGDQEYKFQEGDLELLADAIHHELCGGGKEDGLYVATSMGYTIINKLNSDSNFPERDWAPDKSPLYNLVCQVPCAAHGGHGWYAISDAGEEGGLKNRADAGHYKYCDVCMEAAKYIQKNDSMNFKHNGKFTSGGNCFNAGDPMPHTCWEQGGNYGGGKLWLYYEDYLFDPSQK